MRPSTAAVRVFIIDDSAVVRQVVSELLGQNADIEVIGSAADPIFAHRKMLNDWPDVILLDIEMPRMDGLSFLRKVMAERPTPVIICSTLTEKGAAVSVEALSAGAVEVISKPKVGLKDFLADAGAALSSAVRAAARAKVAQARPPQRLVAPLTTSAARTGQMSPVIALGTSTGGTQALQTTLSALPANCPGILVVQHMPEKFTAAFAQRLDRYCQCEVREAVDGEPLLPGRVLIAPGGRHMQLKQRSDGYWVSVRDGPAVNRHKPSVDVLFRSVAQLAGPRSVGVIMTGMGNDGVRGLLEMRQAGALTAAQDEASSVVFGMPKEAIAAGAALEILPLDEIAAFILRSSREILGRSR